MKLEDFNNNYIYTSDMSKHGRIEHWEVLTKDSDGKYRGDCEDYALTVKKHIYPKGKLYYCRLYGKGHCILVVGENVIDNNCKQLISRDLYIQMYKITHMRKYSKFELFGKWVLSTIINYLLKVM